MWAIETTIDPDACRRHISPDTGGTFSNETACAQRDGGDDRIGELNEGSSLLQHIECVTQEAKAYGLVDEVLTKPPVTAEEDAKD